MCHNTSKIDLQIEYYNFSEPKKFEYLNIVHKCLTNSKNVTEDKSPLCTPQR